MQKPRFGARRRTKVRKRLKSRLKSRKKTEIRRFFGGFLPYLIFNYRFLDLSFDRGFCSAPFSIA